MPVAFLGNSTFILFFGKRFNDLLFSVSAEAVRIVPPALGRHLGEQFNVAAPDSASLRSMYQRRRTLFEHQEVAARRSAFTGAAESRLARGRLIFASKNDGRNTHYFPGVFDPARVSCGFYYRSCYP